MKTYLVQLENHDDVISARDKISWSKARRVLLVWPRHGRVLERRVDLLVLVHYCQQTGAQMAVVTRNGEVKYHARELGIPVFRTPEQAQQAAWRKPGKRKIRWPDRKPVLAEELRQQQGWFSRPGGAEKRWSDNRWLRVIVFSLAVAAFMLLVLSFAPGAQVSLEPLQKTQQLSLVVWASPDIRDPNPSGGLPAAVRSVVVEGRALAESSGRILVPDRYAAGQVLLTNLTDQPVEVSAGSVVSTVADVPIRFITTQNARLPAGPGTSVSVPVQAAAPGRTGNVMANQIQAMEGPLGLRLMVTNLAALTGGSDRSSPAPSQVDFRRLQDNLLKDLHGTAIEELQAELPPGQRLLEGSLRIRSVLAEEREPAEGQPAERLQLTMRVEFEGWSVDEAHIEAVVRPILDASLAGEFQPVPGSFQVEFVDEPVLMEKKGPQETGTVRWKIDVRRSVESGWNDAEVVRVIQGRRVEEARQILKERLFLAGPAEIVLSPAWWGRMPFLPARIALVKQ